MPANIDPIFPATPQTWQAQISTANTNRDGTGTIVDVATGATNGSRVDKVIMIAQGTTAAGVIRLYLYNGSAYRLLKEQMVTATTPSTSVEVNRYEFFNTDGTPICFLPTSSWKLAAAPNNAETWQVIALGGDY